MHWYLDVLFKEDSHKVLNKTAKNELKCIEKNRFSHFKKWTPNTRKKVTSMRQKRVLLSMAFHKFLPSILVTTQPPFGVFFNFTSFICLPFVNTEYIKQG